MLRRGFIATVFTESRKWKKTRDAIHKNDEKEPENPVYQFFNLLGGRVIGKAYSQCIPFETHAERIASDIVCERQWNNNPLALAETFLENLFFNFAEVDWEILPGRSPLTLADTRKCAEVLSVTLRKYTMEMPPNVSIIVCTTLDPYGNPVPFEDEYFKCSGCKHGRVELNSESNLYICTFCESQWTVGETDAHDLSDNEAGSANGSDAASITAGDILNSSEGQTLPAAARNRRGSDSSGQVSAPAVRSARSMYTLVKVGRRCNQTAPRMYRKKKLKNGMHLRCHNFPVNKNKAEQLRRCFINALTSAFPNEPSDVWNGRIDPAPLDGLSLRMCGMWKKGMCCHCNGKGKLRDVGGQVDCVHCHGTGKVAIDKRYGVADELVLGASLSDDYWLSDRAQEEQVAHAARARSCGDDSRDALGYDDLPNSDRLAKFRNVDNTEENWKFILMQTSISNVPKDAVPVELDKKTIRRVPNGEVVQKFTRKHRGKTVEYRMWQTMLSKSMQRSRRNVKNAGTAVRNPTVLRKIHSMIRRMFPYPKLPNGCYDMDIQDHEHPVLGPARQKEYLESRAAELLVTADLEDRDLPPSPYDEAVVDEIKFASKRKDRAFIKLGGTGAKWCPQKHREKLSAQSTGNSGGTSEHSGCPAYFAVNRVARTVQCRCLSPHHMCAECCTGHKNVCEHKWWSKRPDDKKLLLASEFRLLFGDVDSGEAQEEEAVARDVEKLKEMYPFLTEQCKDDPEAIRRCTRQLLEHARIQNDLMTLEPAYATPNMHYCIHYWLTMMQSTASDMLSTAKEMAQECPELAERCERQERQEAWHNRNHNRMRADDLRSWERSCLNGSRSKSTFDENIQRRQREDLFAMDMHTIDEEADDGGSDDGGSDDSGSDDGGSDDGGSDDGGSDGSNEESVDESNQENANASKPKRRKRKVGSTSVARKAERKRARNKVGKSSQRQRLRNIQRAKGKYRSNLKDQRVKHANRVKKALKSEVEDFLSELPDGQLVEDGATESDVEKVVNRMISLATRQVNLRV